MSARHPKAHVYDQGEGGIVMGTHDVGLAYELMLAEYTSYIGSEDEAKQQIENWDKPSLRVGRVIPFPPDGDYAWCFHYTGNGELGKRGVTRAVVWGA